jgi:hypothetical protein
MLSSHRVCDSGASHILIREADAHILIELQYFPAHLPPFAVLKTANGDPLQAIRMEHLGRNKEPVKNQE